MKTKIVFLSILCTFFFCDCTKEYSFTLPEKEWIDIDLTTNFFTQENIDKLKEAKKRFNEFVYKDELGNYKTLLENGKEIAITEPTFDFLVECLKYRPLLDSINNTNLIKKKSRTSPYMDPYERYVFGQLAGMWNKVVGLIHLTQETIVECAQMVAMTCLVAIATMLEFCVSGFTDITSPQYIVPSFYPCEIQPIALITDGQCLGPTNALPGIYGFLDYNGQGSSFPGYYLVIENGMAWGYFCESNWSYSMYRAYPQFYKDEHRYLVY